jgi:hypothetical protein
MTFPWEKQAPLPMPWEQSAPPAAPDLEGTVKALQRDVGYMVTHTAVIVHATGPHAAALGMLFNTRRGQLIPVGEAKYTDGHTIRFQDLGMPQPRAPEMTVQEAVRVLFDAAQRLGLEIAS